VARLHRGARRALLTALSYASLGSRHPRAAGAARHPAPKLSAVELHGRTGAGLLGTDLDRPQSQVFAANIAALFGLEVSVSWLALGFLLILSGIVLRGIRESMWVMCCAPWSSGRLVLVIVVGASCGVGRLFGDAASLGDDVAILLVMQGAVLAFFAFIGFEDIQHRRGSPRA
jgi:amino acid transporter